MTLKTFIWLDQLVVVSVVVVVVFVVTYITFMLSLLHLQNSSIRLEQNHVTVEDTSSSDVRHLIVRVCAHNIFGNTF